MNQPMQQANLDGESQQTTEKFQLMAQTIANRCAEEFARSFDELYTAELSQYDAIESSKLIERFQNVFEPTFHSQVRRKLQLYRSYLNVRQGILKLPVEILQMTFEWTLEELSWAEQRMHQLFRLRKVCHTWQNVADGTPSLWTHISPACHRNFIGIALRRSKDLPLILNDLDSCYTHTSDFFEQVLPHRSRWGSLTGIAMDQEMMDLYFAQLVSCLKILSFNANRGSNLRFPTFGGSLEQLKELELRGWNQMEWGGTRTGNLRSVDLNLATLDLAGVVDLIRENSRLEFLKMRIDDKFIFSSPLSPDQSQIILLHLTTLHIGGGGTRNQFNSPSSVVDNAILHFLQHVQLPACIKYEVEICGDPNHVPDLNYLVRALVGPFDFLKSSSSKLPSSLSPDHLEVKKHQSGLSCSLIFPPNYSNASYELAIHSLPDSLLQAYLGSMVVDKAAMAPIDLHISFYVDYRSELEILANFQDCHNVTQVNLFPCSNPEGALYHRFFQLLSTRSSPLTLGAPILPFPRLYRATFWLEDANQNKLVVKMLIARLSLMEQLGITPVPGKITVADPHDQSAELTWPNLDDIGHLELLESITFSPLVTEDA